MTETLELRPGARLDAYRIEAVLSRDEVGATYLAWDEHHDKRVAIKEYLPRDWAIRLDDRTVAPRASGQRADYQWGLKRFLDDARAQAWLDHPHLNRVDRFFEAYGTAYLVREYIDGEPLSERLRRDGALTPAAVQRLLHETGSALAQIHRAGHVHRDVQPDNILIRDDEASILVNFGTGRQAVLRALTRDDDRVDAGFVSHRRYAPIEQYDSGDTDIGPRTDLYALGMVGYRCVTGCSEADLVTADARARQLYRGGADPLPPAAKTAHERYPRELLEAIDHAVQVAARDRPQSAHDWIGGVQPGHGETDSPWTDSAPRPVRRGRDPRR